LREAEDVVDEEQNVCACCIAELLGHGQAGQCDPRTRTGRLVHLAEAQGDLGVGQVFRRQNTGFDHFVVQVVALTGPLTNTREHRQTGVHFGDVVDQFHDQNGFANTSTAEEADLAAFGIGRQKINNLNAGHKHFGFSGLIREVRRARVDRAVFIRFDRAHFVNRLAGHVEDTAKCCGPNRNHDRTARVSHFLTANKPFGGIHRDCADGVFAEVLRNFENQTVAVVVCFQRVQNFGQVVVELHVHDGADHLRDFAFCISHCFVSGSLTALPRRK